LYAVFLQKGGYQLMKVVDDICYDMQTIALAAKAAISRIPEADRMEILAKSRFSQESRWMMAMVVAAGWDMANRMNLEVGAAVGEAEMHRLMELLEIEKPRDEAEALLLLAIAMELFTTKKYFDYEFKTLGPGKTLGIVYDCYANTKVRAIGVEGYYECGCFGMRSGWYRALGIEPKETLVKCMKDGDDHCEILIDYSQEIMAQGLESKKVI
jgi:hypothetical protein